MPDTPLEHGFSHPYDPSIAVRVTRLEADVGELRQDMKSLLTGMARIEAGLPLLATQAQLGELRTALEAKPDKLYMWGVLGVLVAAVLASFGAGLAALLLLH